MALARIVVSAVWLLIVLFIAWSMAYLTPALPSNIPASEAQFPLISAVECVLSTVILVAGMNMTFHSKTMSGMLTGCILVFFGIIGLSVAALLLIRLLTLTLAW